MKKILIYLRDAFYVPFAAFMMWLHSLLINSTLKIKLVGEDKIEQLHREGKQVIFAFWHQATFSMLYYYRNKGACILPVDNYLGSILAGFTKRYGYNIVRYPQGGSPVQRISAIARIIKIIKDGHDCSIAVDGPPDEKLFNAKPGVFYLAQRTGFPVIPVGAYYSKAHQMNFRWDKYLMPKPFARAILYAGEPIFVKEDVSEIDMGKMCRELEKKIHALTEKAKERCLSK